MTTILLLGWLAFNWWYADNDSPPPFHGTLSDRFQVSPDGTRLLVGNWVMYAIPSGRTVWRNHEQASYCAAFSPDGKLVAWSGGARGSDLIVLDAETGKVYWDLSVRGHPGSHVHQLAFTPDGRYLLSASDSGLLRVWDVREKKAHGLYCFVPEEPRDRECLQRFLQAWQAITGRANPDGTKSFVFHDILVSGSGGFAVCPDGKNAVFATRKSGLLVLDIMTGKIVRKITAGGEVGDLRLAPNASLLAVSCHKDREDESDQGVIEIYDAKTWRRVRSIPAQTRGIFGLAFSRGGRYLATSNTRDGTRVIDARTGRQLCHVDQFPGDEDCSRSCGVEFMPDESAVLTRIWGCPSPVRFHDPNTGVERPKKYSRK